MNTKRNIYMRGLYNGIGLFVCMVLGFNYSTEAQRLLTLDQAVNEALEKSPDIIQSRLSLVRSKENLNAQRASLKSNFRLNLEPYSFTRDRRYSVEQGRWIDIQHSTSTGNFSVEQPIIWTDGVISLNNRFNWQDSYSSLQGNTFKGFSNNTSISLEQPVFTYNRRKLELKELELAYENSQLNYALRELNVERQITQYFYQVYQTQMNLITSREEYENRKKSYEIIKNKVEAGLSAKEELLQAELDMMSSQSTVQNNEVDLENTKDNFKQLLGIPLEEEIMVIADVAVIPVDVDLQTAIQYGLENRMELRQREIEIESSQFDIIKTNAINEFKGNIGVEVGLFGQNEQFKDIYSRPTDNQSVNFSLDIPLWDWGEKKARLRAAEASLEAQQYSLKDEEVNIKLTIRQIHRNLSNLLTQIQIARKNEENAQLTYEINLERYRNGDLTSMDLNLQQNQLTQKKNALTNALINYKIEVLNMKLQTLYDFENKQLVIPDVESVSEKF
jgi:outer membrane protein TolC